VNARSPAREARSLTRKEKPRYLSQVAGFWRRPIDSFVATLARYPRGLDRLPAGFPARRVLCSSRRRQKTPADHLIYGCSVLATSYSRTACRRTTIGAAAFHCRVRNGNGWCHCATVTRNLRRACRSKFLAAAHSRRVIGDLLTVIDCSVH
jgi:hypothetical protein